MSSYYFTVIGNRDNLLYELEFSSFKTGVQHPGRSHFPPKVRELLPFITNSSLDLIEDAQWGTSAFHLGKVDSFYGLQVTAFVTQGNVKLVLCNDSEGLESLLGVPGKHDETAIRQFFTEVYDLYVKTLLNPFYAVNDPIVLPDFDLRVKYLARKYL